MSSKASKSLTKRKGIATFLGAVTAIGFYVFVYRPYKYRKDMLSFEAEARYLFQKQKQGQDSVDHIQVLDGRTAS